jgi:hypothetical protein
VQCQRFKNGKSNLGQKLQKGLTAVICSVFNEVGEQKTVHPLQLIPSEGL